MIQVSTSVRGRATRAPGFDTGWRLLPWSLIQVVERGAYRVAHADGAELLEAGDLWFVPGGCRHRHVVVGSDPVVTAWWQGDVRIHAAIDPLAGLGRMRFFRRAAHSRLGRALRVVIAQPTDDLVAGLVDQARVLTLVAELARALGAEIPASSPVVATTLAPVFRFVDANLHLPLERHELAARAGLAASRFHELFLAATGVAPMAWVRQRRLALAADLLTGTDLGMAEIAQRSGFCDAFHLNKRFRAAYGIPPTAFRRSARG
jgi:AraC-like DNA-binding protein